MQKGKGKSPLIVWLCYQEWLKKKKKTFWGTLSILSPLSVLSTLDYRTLICDPE